MKNLTTGNPVRLLLAFTMPLLLGNLFQQAYQVTDAIVVGQLLGVEGLAAVGAGGSLIFLLMGMVWGSSAGLAIPISKAFGARDMGATRTAVAAGVYVALGIAAVITAVGVGLGQPLLRLLGAPAEVFDGAWAYLAVTFGGSITAVAFNYLSAAIRAVGDAKTPLLFLIAASVINAVLVVVFVGTLGLGLAGAAATTVIAQGLATSACLIYVKARIPAIIPTAAEWRAGWRLAPSSARIGVPMGLQVSVIAVGAVVLQGALNSLGTDAVAAFTAGVRVDQIATTAIISIGVALVTFVAQNRGAEQWSRIRHGVSRMAAVSVLFSLAAGAGFLLFADQLVALFVRYDSPEVHALAVQFLAISAFTYSFLALKFVLRGAVQGLGNTLIPTISSFLELAARATVAIFFVGTFGFTAAVLAGPIAWAAACLLLIPTWLRMRAGLIAKERAHATLLASLAAPAADAAPANPERELALV